MEKLTQKMKRQLAYLMICTLFFNSVPTWDMFVYAQGDGNANTLSDSTSGGDVSGNGTTSGNDTPGTGSGEDADVIPSHDGFDYDGFEMVTDEDDNILTDVSGNDITEDMYVYAKGTVEYTVHLKNVQNTQTIIVKDNDVPVEDGVEWENYENNEGDIIVSVSEEGIHQISLEYRKDGSEPQEIICSATICIDSEAAKLSKVIYRSSGESVEVIPEGERLTGDGITRYYNEYTEVQFELAESFFNSNELLVTRSHDGTDEPIEYTTTSNDGVVCVISKIYKNEAGTHVISFKYRDSLYNCDVVYETTIVIDTVRAELIFSPTEWKSAWLEDSQQDDTEIFHDAEKIADTFYYQEGMQLGFTITEEYFHASDVEFYVDSDIKPLTWQDKNNDDRYATYPIEDMGEHEIVLSYQDRSGNEPPIEFSKRIILDNSNPNLEKVQYTEWDQAVSSGDLSTIEGYSERQMQGVNLYYGCNEGGEAKEVDIKFIIEENNFHAKDVVCRDNGTKILPQSDWTQGTGDGSDSWSAKYSISGEGIHVITLEYEDRSGNPIQNNLLETFILDFKAPKIVLGNREDSSDKEIYCGKGQEINLCIKEENFRAMDVVATVSGGDANAINGKLQKSDNWKENPDGCHSTQITQSELGNDGKYNIAINYKDLALNEASEETALVIVDTEAPKVVKDSYDKNTDCFRRMVDKDNGTVTDDKDAYKYIYQDPMTYELTIQEENFDFDLLEVTVYRNGIKVDEGDGYQYKYVENRTLEEKTFHQHRILFTIGKNNETIIDGDYQIVINGKDKAMNPMNSYTSKIITVDKTVPQITVDYDDEEKDNDVKNERYYQKARVATITVMDENLVSGDITVDVTAKDIAGTVIPDYNLDKKQSAWSYDKEQKTLTSTITYDIDANYQFNITCKDMAGNPSSKSDSFTVDGTPPAKENFSVTYSTPIMESSEEDLQNAFYQDKVKVTITAKDEISPIDSFEWIYTKQPGTSSINRESESEVIKSDNITYDLKQNTATANFTLTAEKVAEIKQYRGNISFKATDKADNTSEAVADSNQIVIVDNISPTRKVTYSKANHIVNKDTLETLNEFDYSSEDAGAVLFYSEPMKITLTVNEANFYSNDVIVKKNGIEESITDWTKNGDEWTGNLNISEDGEYVVTVQYRDRSDNGMKDYVSHTIVIDTVKPKINVSYAPNDAKQTIDGTKYYDTEQTATITIEERNFRADDVKAVVKATDINGNSIDVQDFSAYLSNRDNWVTKGDTHTAKIEFVKDANYEFDIDYKDLALISADDYPKDVFTVDQTAPTNVSVSYSSPISERTILGTEYSFYQDPIVVTITAEDDVSGVHSFDYSYIRATGVSSVNAESISDKMEGEDIKYSDDKKTATATFVIPASELRSGNQLNGNMEFVANNRSMLNTEYKDSNRYVVDNIAPNVTITVNGTEQQADGSSYYSEDVNITITVDEANFYKEDVKVSISKDGGEQYAAGVYWKTISVDRHVGSITLSEEGNYKVYISYQDPSTNGIEDYQSNLLIIDKTQPSINVSGIKYNSANKQETIGFVVTVEDANLNTSSFIPVLMAEIKDESGEIRQVDCTELGTIETVTLGKSCTYTISNISQDGIYQFTCLASDMSGNTTESMIIEDSNKQTMTELNYSVNRNGSTYSLGEATRKLVNNFVKAPIDVVVYETNPDEISNIKITLFKNDETLILEDGKDYVVKKVSDKGEWYKYEYTIYNTNFADDGTYRISIYSEDKAGNIAENNLDVKDVEISFGIDKTLPNLIVTNLESKATYPVDKLSVLMRATDNMKLQSITVELDGTVIASWDEEQIQQMSNDLQDFVFEIMGDETTAHSVTITLTDIAGNQRIETISDFYVTTNLWIRFINNKVLFYGSIIACLTMGLVFVLLLMRKRRHQ